VKRAVILAFYLSPLIPSPRWEGKDILVFKKASKRRLQGFFFVKLYQEERERSEQSFGLICPSPRGEGEIPLSQLRSYVVANSYEMGR
jgi:hypothetical protein